MIMHIMRSGVMSVDGVDGPSAGLVIVYRHPASWSPAVGSPAVTDCLLLVV